MAQDKAAEMEERFNRLEEKLRLTFIEIEKRMSQQQQKPETSADDRINELEDLILLLQLENTKLKERVGEGLDFGIAPATPGLEERISSIESELSSYSTPTAHSDIDAKIAALEEKLNSVGTVPVEVPKHVEKHVKEALAHDVKDLEKRIRTLEALLEKRGQEEIEKESTLLADIRGILNK